jgi:hypothetical protein
VVLLTFSISFIGKISVVKFLRNMIRKRLGECPCHFRHATNSKIFKVFYCTF